MKTINFLAFAFSLFFCTGLSAQNNCENDTTPPVAVCIPSLAFNTDENGEFILFVEDIEDGSFDNCSEVTFSFFSNMSEEELVFTEESQSPTSISLYVNDANGNQSACYTEIVINGQDGSDCSNDDVAPVAICNADVMISLGNNNEATLAIQAVNEQSFDHCFGSNISLSFSETEIVSTLTFDENSDETSNVFLYVTDPNGNQAVCFATVTIDATACDNDTQAPQAICKDKINIHLTSNDEVSLHVEDLDDGSYDNCSAVTLSFFENMIEETIRLNENTQSPTLHPMFVSDASGNQNVCHVEIVIDGQDGSDCTDDDLAPVAICSDMVTIYLDQNNRAILALEDINDSSTDFCFGSNISLSFSATESVSTLTFDENSPSPSNVNLYVTDPNGNQSNCWGEVNIVQGEMSESVFGYVKTEAGEALQGTKVDALDATGQVVETTIADANGRYEFTNLIVGVTYTIQPEKDAALLNGVTTFDMVLSRRHILGIQQLALYRIFAGDVNDSNTLTTFDLVETRKLILGYEPGFSYVTSWKFIRSTAVFSNPHQFDLGHVQNNSFQLTVGQTNSSFDFIGVKVGDTNASADNN